MNYVCVAAYLLLDFIFVAIQWKFEHGNLTAINHWIYEQEIWSVPDEGEEGFIKFQDDDVVMSVSGQSVGSKGGLISVGTLISVRLQLDYPNDYSET